MYDIKLADGERILKFKVKYDDTSPLTMFNIPANTIVDRCWVQITTEFAGTTPTLAIGDEDGASGFLAEGKITEGTVGIYGVEDDDGGSYLWDTSNTHKRIKAYTATKAIQATIGGTDLTAGEAMVYFLVRKLPGGGTQ